MAFEIAKNKKGYIFPYTCPFFESSEEDVNKCMHMNELKKWSDPKFLSRLGCSYGRRICYIAVDPCDLNHSKNPNELIKILPADLPSDELETISLNIKDYYVKFYKGKVE